MTMKKACAAVWLISTSLTAAVPAFAQTAAPAADEATTNDSEIVVTARKRAEALIDVPLAVTVATAAQLSRDQVYNLTDLQRITPALEVSQTSGGETNGGGRLRGLGTGVFNPSVAPSVALVVDQAPIGNLSFPQLYDLAQVEVLRGPQGTLFGQGASAGVLNITTRDASTERLMVSGSVDFADKGSAGSEVGELVLNGALNLPISDQAAIRVATQYKKETGLQRSVTTGRDNEIEDFGIRIRTLLKPTERFTVHINGEYGQNTSNGQNFAAIAIAPNSTAPFGPPGGTLGAFSTGQFLNPAGCAMTVISARAEQYCEAIPTLTKVRVGAISAVLDWEVSDTLSLTSVSNYRERRNDLISRDFSRLSTAAAARQERTREDSRGFSEEIRASVTTDAFDLVAGGFYSDFQFDRKPLGNALTFGSTLQGERIGFSVCPASGIGFCPVRTSFTDELTRNRTLAAFADATVKLGPQFQIFGGLRFTDYKNTTNVQIFAATTGPLATFTTTESNLSGRIGASFRPNPNTNLYASYARGYKPTAVGTKATGALFELKPELSDAFEVGARFNIGRFQLAANAFHTKIANFQSQTQVFVGTALISEPLNVPSVTSKGFEITAYGRLLPGLNINAGYQYNDIKFPAGYLGDDSTATNPLVIGGTQFLNAPKHKFTLSGEYATAVGNSLEVFLNGNIVYKSAVLLAARADPRYRYPAHELINIGFGLRDPGQKWTASVFVRNLTKEREPTTYIANTFAGQPDGGIRAWPVAGLTARVVGARLGFNF